MADILSQLAEPLDEQKAWHEYKDGVEGIDGKRAWSIRALASIDDVPVYVAATKAIEAAFDEQEGRLKARYNNVRRQLGLPV